MDHPEAHSTESFAARLAIVRENIAAACMRANRSTEAVTLIAVSKTHPATLLVEAVQAGIRQFGENRIEEADKIAPVEAAAAQINALPLTWHMIGHVQSRKARDVVQTFTWIHSLDSVALAERYARLVTDRQLQPVNVLLEINISGETSKEGFAADRWAEAGDQRHALWDAVQQIAAVPGIQVRGLMTVAPIVEEPEQVRPFFANLRKLGDALASDFPQAQWDHLSMGMTDDYPIAIEEGATFIRVGRALFGSRVT